MKGVYFPTTARSSKGPDNHCPKVSSKRKAEEVETNRHKRTKTDTHMPLKQVYEQNTPNPKTRSFPFPRAPETTEEMDEETKAAVQSKARDDFLQEVIAHYKRYPEDLPKWYRGIDVQNIPCSQDIPHPKDILINHGQDNYLLVVGSPKHLEHLCNSERVHMGGIPILDLNLFHPEIFVIYGVVNGQVLPLLYCLLPETDRATYTLLFRLIKDKAVQQGLAFNPRVVWVDYNAAIANSLRYVYRGVTIKGCYFQYCQLLTQSYRRYGLTPHTNKPGVVRTVIYRLMCLPFLPVEDIVDTFNDITYEDDWDALPPEVNFGLGEFVEDVRYHWVEGNFGLERWNVWSTDSRTNNCVRSCNSGKRRELDSSCCDLYSQLRFLHRELKCTTVSILLSFAGHKTRPQPKAQRDKEAQITSAKEAYRAGTTNAVQYLDELVEIRHPPRKQRKVRRRGGHGAKNEAASSDPEPSKK